MFLKGHLIKKTFNQKGQFALVGVVVAAAILVVVTARISAISLSNYQVADVSLNSVNAYYLAESGLEDALLRLSQDVNYAGGSYSTPIGNYTITVDKDGYDYTVYSESTSSNLTKKMKAELTLESISDAVTNYIAFGGDDIWMYWADAQVWGNIWSNDDINFTDNSVVYGDVYALGSGNLFTSWVNWGAEIKDNPGTSGITEGNIYSANDIKVWGGHVYGNAYSEGWIIRLFGGQIDGLIRQNYDLNLEQIEIPAFSFLELTNYAKAHGTYFANASQFITFVNGFDNGITRTIPDGIYVINKNDIVFGAGRPIVLNGSIVSGGNFQLYCGATINAINNFPAISSQGTVEIRDYGWPTYGGDFVTINGVVYSNTTIALKHDDSHKTIKITGAVWAGDDIMIEESSEIHYNPDVANTAGFGFVVDVGDIDLQSWTQVL